VSDLVRRHNSSPAKKAPAKKAVAKKAPAKKAVAKKAPAKKAPSRMKTSPTAGAGSLKALPKPPTDPWTILGLTEPCTLAELRRSWRAYASRHHPDQGGDTATFARGRAAYEELIQRLW
jgi:hypothetical protein